MALGQTESSVLEPQTATGPGKMSCEIVFPCTENETEMSEHLYSWEGRDAEPHRAFWAPQGSRSSLTLHGPCLLRPAR